MQAGVLGLKRGAGTGTRDPPAEARNAVVGLVFLGEGSFEAKAEMSLLSRSKTGHNKCLW